MFYDNFVKLCREKGVSKGRACSEIGLAKSAWNKWTTGGAPNGNNLQKIADYFCVSVADIIGSETTTAPTPEPTPSTAYFASFSGYSRLTDSEKEAVQRDVQNFAQYCIQKIVNGGNVNQ